MNYKFPKKGKIHFIYLSDEMMTYTEIRSTRSKVHSDILNDGKYKAHRIWKSMWLLSQNAQLQSFLSCLQNIHLFDWTNPATMLSQLNSCPTLIDLGLLVYSTVLLIHVPVQSSGTALLSHFQISEVTKYHT